MSLRATMIIGADLHVHLREGDMLAQTVPYTASYYQQALVMPNLSRPITTAKLAIEYWDQIMKHVPKGLDFEPLMTLYLTDETTPADIQEAKEAGVVAVKYYPAGQTTNSAHGVQNILGCTEVLAAMQDLDMVLCMHGEVATPGVDIFDKERKFYEPSGIAQQLVERYPRLRVVCEHITTIEAARFVISAPETVAATITPQHLMIDRNAILDGGIKPHNYCLPIAKRSEDMAALVHAATSGISKFFLGTDSAPHAQNKKESACGCAGCFTAPHSLALYATVFDKVGALDKLEQFASLFGRAFYRLDIPRETVEIVQKVDTIPRRMRLIPWNTPWAPGDHHGKGRMVVPFMAGCEIPFTVRPRTARS